METLYHQTTQLIQEASDLFQQLEKDVNNAEPIENAIQSKINAINASRYFGTVPCAIISVTDILGTHENKYTWHCEKLDVFVFKTPINSRPMAKMRVDQLKYDSKHIQASLNNAANKRRRREQERAEREQLLSRRFGPGHDHTVTVDYLAQEQHSLHNSHRNVDEMLHTGSNILQTLRYNRDTLKGAHKRLIDLANTLGLSNATISLIERRVSQDKYVLFGGMFITLAVIVLVIIYLA